jgi:hypothetical protein
MRDDCFGPVHGLLYRGKVELHASPVDVMLVEMFGTANLIKLHLSSLL